MTQRSSLEQAVYKWWLQYTSSAGGDNVTDCPMCKTRHALKSVLDILDTIPDFDGSNVYDDAIVELYTATQSVIDLFRDDCPGGDTPND